MICFPNSKINIGLHVINKREDGFHNIETVFYPLPLCDMLEVVKSKKDVADKVDFLSDGLKIEGDKNDNLIVKAYKLLDNDFDLDPVQFFLYKKIPMGAGLGGGSSDAAFAIKLLNDFFSLSLSSEQMKKYASILGSDCAFFIDNKPAYVFGRGFELENISIDLSKYFITLLFPNVHSGTAIAYQHVVKRGVLDESQSLKKLIGQPISNWKNTIENDFEKSVFKFFPQLEIIKQKLYDSGALYSSMSGSGSAMFGIFENEPTLPDDLRAMLYYLGRA